MVRVWLGFAARSGQCSHLRNGWRMRASPALAALGMHPSTCAGGAACPKAHKQARTHLDHGGGEAGGGGALAAGVDGAGQEGRHVPAGGGGRVVEREVVGPGSEPRRRGRLGQGSGQRAGRRGSLLSIRASAQALLTQPCSHDKAAAAAAGRRSSGPLEHLGLGAGGVAHDSHVDVAAQVDALRWASKGAGEQHKLESLSACRSAQPGGAVTAAARRAARRPCLPYACIHACFALWLLMHTPDCMLHSSIYNKWSLGGQLVGGQLVQATAARPRRQRDAGLALAITCIAISGVVLHLTSHTHAFDAVERALGRLQAC